MPASDALHDLIHSLDQSEKRHFKIFAKRHVLNGENQYVRLFEALDALQTYDEAALQARLGNTKNLAANKNYLYNLLLRSLRGYHAGRSARTTLHELWLDIQVLMEKGLLKQAGKLIRKAKKLAAEYHYDIHLLEIMLLERKMTRRYTSNKADEIICEQQTDCHNALRRLQYRLQMLDLYETIFLNYRNQNEALQSLAGVVDQAEQLFPSIQPQDRTFEAIICYHLLHFNHANLQRDYQSANHHLRDIIALYETHPILIDEDPERYINMLNNYLNNCFLLKHLEEFPAVLAKMKATKTGSFRLRALVFQNVHYLEMLYRLVREEYAEVIRMVPAIEAGLQQYEGNITKSRELTFCYNIAIAYFLEKVYPEALAWVNRILNEPKLEERQDIQSLSRIFQIVLHYQLDNQQVAEYLIQSAERYLRKKDKRQSPESIIIKHLKQALYAPAHEEKLIFANLAQRLESLKGLEEIKIWVKRRLTA